jgi:hypothetical protein
VSVEPEANERGERTVRLNRMVATRLGAIRGQGESMSDVILRIAAEWVEAPAARSRSPAHDKVARDTGGRDVVIDDHQGRYAPLRLQQRGVGPHHLANGDWGYGRSLLNPARLR